MMIIKIIILYFIQIRHTDNFPSTDIRLVLLLIMNPDVIITFIFSPQFSSFFINLIIHFAKQLLERLEICVSYA